MIIINISGGSSSIIIIIIIVSIAAISSITILPFSSLYLN